MAGFFVDTNVLVYAFAEHEPAKRAAARGLTEADGALVSTQVLAELANVMTRRLGFAPDMARNRIASIAASCEVVTVTPPIVLDALRIMQTYRYSFFDSQIIATALAAGAEVLYSEDMHHGQTIDSTLRIRSPFRVRAEQARGTYQARRTRRPIRRR